MLHTHLEVPSRSSSAGAVYIPGIWTVTLTTEARRNYDHVASLWEHEKWLPEAAVNLARAHYAAYAVQRKDGLRVITLNTDFCELTP